MQTVISLFVVALSCGMSLPAVLTIAGSDPSGGAGIQVRMEFAATRLRVWLTGFGARSGRFEDLHRVELLRDQRHHSTYRAEHDRCARGSPVSPGICQRSGVFWTLIKSSGSNSWSSIS